MSCYSTDPDCKCRACSPTVMSQNSRENTENGESMLRIKIPMYPSQIIADIEDLPIEVLHAELERRKIVAKNINEKMINATVIEISRLRNELKHQEEFLLELTEGEK